VNHDKITELRQRYLGPSLRFSYTEPLHIVKGKGQYLFSTDGQRYLDCVNNIQHVGHCHPKVVEAAKNQYEKLNTNTRYLDETIICYARDIIETMPDGLDICFFTNSGSEANDLALRIARNSAKNNETIVLDGAYHGNLSSLIEISPYKHNGPGGNGTPDHVHVIPMPDSFRGKFRGEGCTENYIQEVEKKINKIKKRSDTGFTFIFESLMGCGGQLIPPEGFFHKTTALVESSFGLCIADEVQIGFGRMGSHFWGFDSECIVPDIVTLGKSMGNGHPLSAVITTRELAEQFNNGMEYFNSFGGNPVSCAVGQAVLDVIKDEELQANASKVGAYLLGELESLHASHGIIGDVRGRGLFIGIELVKNSNLEPARKEAHIIVNQMKEKRVLLSTDGPDHNVIKIKPPMVFNKENADKLVNKLNETLSEL